MPKIPRLDPPYLLAAAYFRQQITSGAWAEGNRIPPQTELAEELDVTTPTVHKALKVLEGEGLVYSDSTRGRFVAARSKWQLNNPNNP